MLTTSPEPDVDRLSALYRYGVLDCGRDAFLEAVTQKLAAAFGGMTVQAVMVDDHRLWTAASTGDALDERGKQNSLAAGAIEQVEPLVIDDILRDGRFARSPSVLDAPRLRAYAGVSIRTPDNFAIGMLAASDIGARAFRASHITLLERGAARIMERLETRRLTRLDEPTGALNQAAFRDQVAALAAVSLRHRRDLSVLAVEIGSLRDLLQSFHGDLGRLVIDRMSGLGRNNVRRLDSFGRLADGTFAVLLPNTDEAGARSLGLRIVEALAEGWTFPAEDGRATKPAGVGIATLRPGLDSADDLIGRAVQDCRRLWLGDPVPVAGAARVA